MTLELRSASADPFSLRGAWPEDKFQAVSDTEIIDPNDFSYDIDEISESCISYIQNSVNQTAAISLAVTTLLNSLKARNEYISDHQYFQKLELIEQLLPFKTMDADKKKELVENWFDFALKKRYPDPNVTLTKRNEVFLRLMRIYKESFELLGCTRLLVNACVKFVQDSHGELCELNEALAMTHGFIGGISEEDTGNGEQYRRLDLELVHRSVRGASGHNRLGVLEGQVFETSKYFTTQILREQLYISLAAVNFNFDSILEWGLQHFKKRELGNNALEVVLWLLIKTMSETPGCRQAALHETISYFFSLPDENRLVLQRICENDFELIFYRVGDIGFDKLTDVSGENWKVDPFIDSDWYPLFRKLTSFLSALSHGKSEPSSKTLEGLFNYALVHLFTVRESISFEKLQKCCEHISDILVGTKPSFHVRMRIFYVYTLMQKQFYHEFKGVAWDGFKRTYARCFYINRGWEDDVVKSVCELSDISDSSTLKEDVEELYELARDWIELMFLDQEVQFRDVSLPIRRRIMLKIAEQGQVVQVMHKGLSVAFAMNAEKTETPSDAEITLLIKIFRDNDIALNEVVAYFQLLLEHFAISPSQGQILFWVIVEKAGGYLKDIHERTFYKILTLYFNCPLLNGAWKEQLLKDDELKKILMNLIRHPIAISSILKKMILLEKSTNTTLQDFLKNLQHFSILMSRPSHKLDAESRQLLSEVQALLKKSEIIRQVDIEFRSDVGPLMNRFIDEIYLGQPEDDIKETKRYVEFNWCKAYGAQIQKLLKISDPKPWPVSRRNKHIFPSLEKSLGTAFLGRRMLGVVKILVDLTDYLYYSKICYDPYVGAQAKDYVAKIKREVSEVTLDPIVLND